MTSRRQRQQPDHHNDTNLYSSYNFSEAFYDSDSTLINDHEIVQTQEHVSMEPSSLCPAMHNYTNLELGCYQPQSNIPQTSNHDSIARASTSHPPDSSNYYVANDHPSLNSSNHDLNFQPSSAMSSGQAEYQRKRKSMLYLFSLFFFFSIRFMLF